MFEQCWIKNWLAFECCTKFCERLSLNPCFLNVDFKHMVLIMPSLLWGHIRSCTIRFLWRFSSLRELLLYKCSSVTGKALVVDRLSWFARIPKCYHGEMGEDISDKQVLRLVKSKFFITTIMRILKETATVMGLLFSSFETCIIIHRHLYAGVTLISKSKITKCVGY